MEAAQKKAREEQAVVNGALANALTMITAKLSVLNAGVPGTVVPTASGASSSVPIPVAMPVAPERGSVLADRGPAPSGPAKRLVGGKARLGHRLSTIGHVVGDLEDDEFEKLSETMALGAQVEPRTRARLLNVARSHGGSHVTDMLIDTELMELGGGHGKNPCPGGSSGFCWVRDDGKTEVEEGSGCKAVLYLQQTVPEVFGNWVFYS